MAGFSVVGVDIDNQPRYPYQFFKQDVMSLDTDWIKRNFDAVHASPPCQSYSSAFKHMAHPQPMLIDDVRQILQRTGLPYIIENVVGAPLIDPVVVCGTGLGMRIYRHRLFESNFKLVGTKCDHRNLAMNPHNFQGRARIYREFPGESPEVVWGKEMGVQWMNKHETRESIPPLYTKYLGEQMIRHIVNSNPFCVFN